MPAIGKSLEVGKVYATDRAHIPAWRVCLGGSGMRLRTILTCVAAAIVAASPAAGCGSKSSTKTGNVKLVLNSGMGLTLTPTTATVPTNELQQFNVVLSNDLQNQGVTWLVTQSTATTTITEPNVATCSPTCGTITSSGLTGAIYTAPATIPTASTPA